METTLRQMENNVIQKQITTAYKHRGEETFRKAIKEVA
jgi:hypothetical protein